MKTLNTVLFSLILFANLLYAQFDPTDFEGMWRGTWFNNTFGSTDSAFLSVTINQGTSTLEAILDLDGNVFGGTDPDPITLTGSYDNNGFSAMGTSSTYGDMFLSGDANGNMTGRMPSVPNPGIDSTTLSGTYNETNIDLAYLVYFAGGGTADGVINLLKDPTSGVERESDLIPDVFSLEQNYPNPFNPATMIKFSIPEASNVSLKIYDVLGNEIATLVDEYRSAGKHEIEFNPGTIVKNPASSIYFYQLKTEGYIETKKMLLLK